MHTCSTQSRSVHVSDQDWKEELKGMTLCCNYGCIEGRNKVMCTTQLVISVLLYARHASKRGSAVLYMHLLSVEVLNIRFLSQVITRLNKLGVCFSHIHTTNLIKTFGANHDQLVLEWKKILKLIHMKVHQN